MDNSNIFKSQEFMRDLGLDFDVEILTFRQKGFIEENPIKKTNLLSFISSASDRMDSSDNALYIHMKNLVLTYGCDAVAYALKEVSGI